ncbi:D-alanyl-D-alanine carboxypeptidase/D-alanyl-D-alanine-endopeptidase [Desulforhopalus sp. IMCC35007]|uniref:D-alanyl-D-alanine carboxypeptidase/D-alanyl-D-alanine-endopeptidase n=1 Tax=Desulforhopalus sp. IMCC35007 TaxID=2569543 RepID=UPI00145D2B5B|nr:D-alanyl-D-alanine carboxypeptidase [Desulforhopalus sp. IMCC35007]
MLVVIFFILSITTTVYGRQSGSITALTELVTNGSYLVKSETKTIGYRQQELFTPASTLKILTALVALELLGPQFRFETHFYIDETQNLYIKGYGDPFLTSEEILSICSSLKKLGLNTIQNVYLDTTAFMDEPTPGSNNSTNPYDAPYGGLAVNFNSLAIKKDPDGTIASGEPQTPTLPMMTKLGKDLPPGIQRINIALLSLNDHISAPLQYAGELFSAQLKRSGISIQKDFQVKAVPSSLPPILIHKNSKNLEKVLYECLYYSNNFIANQLFLSCGLYKYGSPASLDKSRSVMTNYLESTLGLSPSQITVDDGSGLSRKNRISTEALVKILDKFKPYSHLLRNKEGILLKSGTMTGVYCYGGYIIENDNLTPFAILLNQSNNTRDDLLKRLQALYRLSK